MPLLFGMILREISGNLWDAQPYNVEEFTAGKVVHMEGRREVYNNTPQVNQITLRLPTFGEPNDPADFKEKPPVNPSEVREYLEQMILRLREANLAACCSCSLSKV